MNGLKTLAAAVLATVLVSSSGCGDSEGMSISGSDKTIAVSCVRAPERQIPENIRKIAVAEFKAANAKDAHYGQVTADKLVSQLDEANRQFDRYVLVDRQNLKKIMDERDLQLAISDEGSATKAGKIAKVDGLIFGSVNVDGRFEDATKTSFRTGGRGGLPQPYQEHYKKYVLNVNVSLSLVDVQTGKTIVARDFPEKYDSDKDKGDKGLAGLLNLNGASDRKSETEAADILIDRCVKQFINMISPVKATTKYKLAKSKNKLVTQGNSMAAAGDLTGAMETYKEALSINPDDDAACYNAGLVCEARGDTKGADEYYTRAIGIKGDGLYIQARARVRAAAPAPAPAPEGGR